jgi:hypothetical protein
MAISVFLSMLVIQTVRSLMIRNRVNSSGMKRMTLEKPCSRQHPAPKQSMVCQGFLGIFGTTWEKNGRRVGSWEISDNGIPGSATTPTKEPFHVSQILVPVRESNPLRGFPDPSSG